MSFHNKLVWFKCPNCLMEDIPVAAARIPVSVLPASYWFCCWAVPLSYITSCGACCSYWLVRALFSCCSLELMSCLLPALWPSNFSAKKQQICKVVFHSSDSLSTSSTRSSYGFCIHLISFLLFDMSCFPSVFIPSCVNVRIVNSAVRSFCKQLSVLSKRFSKSSMSLVGCCCKCG